MRNPDRINNDDNDGDDDDYDNDDDYDDISVPTFKGSIMLTINFKILKHRYIIQYIQTKRLLITT